MSSSQTQWVEYRCSASLSAVRLSTRQVVVPPGGTAGVAWSENTQSILIHKGVPPSAGTPLWVAVRNKNKAVAWKITAGDAESEPYKSPRRVSVSRH